MDNDKDRYFDFSTDERDLRAFQPGANTHPRMAQYAEEIQEYLGFKEIQRLDEHIMQAYDDATWEDNMADFRVNHPQYLSQPYMSFGARR